MLPVANDGATDNEVEVLVGIMECDEFNDWLELAAPGGTFVVLWLLITIMLAD